MYGSDVTHQASINTRNAQCDEHFRSTDFFDVEHYPYLTFKSKQVLLHDANRGQLTTGEGEPQRYWRLNWNAVLTGGGLMASDDITVTIDLELTKSIEAVASTQADGVSA
ncbi:MAG: hypothetical protein NVS4B12_22810 [Ktedonobacteraceae bacterium]